MTVLEHDEILRYLGERIEYTKRSKSRDLLYMVYGALNMAHNLGFISNVEYEDLQQKVVYGE